MQNREPAKRYPDSRLLPIGNPSRTCCSAHGGGPDAAPAWGADVVSSNIVGYQKLSLASGYNMVGVQFQQVGGDKDSTISGFGPLEASFAGYDEDYNFATIMEVWNGNGYTQYGWSGTSGTDVDEDASYDNQWLDAMTEITDDTISLANGVWVKAAASGVMTLSGEVPADDTVEVSLNAGYNIVSYPYPAEVKVSDFGTLAADFAGYDEDYNFATIMEVWNGNGYTQYGWSGTSGTDVDEDASYDNQWLDSMTEKTTATIPIGTAVWIKAEKAGKLTFKSPISE